MMLGSPRDKRLSTEPLDEAMKELLDVCQQCNDKFQNVTNQRQNKAQMNNFAHDKFDQHIDAATRCDSVERLQKKQSELQHELDQVLEIAKNLEAKQERLQRNNGPRSRQLQLDEDEDCELVEFQQIENELRVSELNRQMNNVQEELRLKLYSRLLTNANNGSKSSKDKESIRRNSVQTDESTPPSSSCSDEQTASSCNSISDVAYPKNNADLQAALQSNHTYEVLRSTKEPKLALQIDINEPAVFNHTPFGPNTYSLNPTKDLGRIDEGEEGEEEEEEEDDRYSNSTMLRKIYEEKLSPILQGDDKTDNTDIKLTPEKKKKKSEDDFRFNASNINSAKRGNRPLTVFLPRPDEEIDLVEMVQNIGHDLDIVSKDLRVRPTSAYGYIDKMSSARKWLRRFFYFDRQTKTLSYYTSEERLVKNSSPKCTITFDEIGDVYVDHRSSELSERHKGIRRYVFVLSTLRRKYILSSERAETMRAWIDILYTAASKDDDFY